ncbi:hypothetical protein [Zoogloea sp.]|uniref:hypothetical protein n=1 Tax=Zoogloea sp. TaxID=49181 RepID=UPI0025FC38D7|nr:hypothetical protein [Zoogloea sp.]MCK6392689.1 hypothetical protein [Zoogloea sp.]MCK6407602.1 hypothetical protein [Thauera sp.]
MTTLKDIRALLAILACYGIAGRMDYDDALRHEEYMRSRSVERLACVHDVHPTRTDAPPADRNALAATAPDLGCEMTSF